MPTDQGKGPTMDSPDSNDPFRLTPIATFHSSSRHPYEARRQASLDDSGEVAFLELTAGRGFEQALEDLEGFDRVWLIYLFDRNRNWKPKVLPPRGPRVKRGVFSTRAPYRPNPIGLSCVRLKRVEGLRVFVEGHDLLDGTPILDIKPYVAYADAFPESRSGWLEGVDARAWRVKLSPACDQQLNFLEKNGVGALRGFLQAQLEYEPLDGERKRVIPLGDGIHLLAYRTWRAEFHVNVAHDELEVTRLLSGYEAKDLEPGADDRWGDKELHREFIARFGDGST